MAEEGAEQPNLETQVESFLSESLGPVEEKTLKLDEERGLFKAADKRLDLPTLADPPYKFRQVRGNPWLFERIYETNRGDTFYRLEMKDQKVGNGTITGMIVTRSELIRLGPDKLEAFKRSPKF